MFAAQNLSQNPCNQNPIVNFFDAIKNNNLDLIKSLLTSYPNLITQYDAKHGFPLLIALKYSNDEVVKFLLTSLAALDKNQLALMIKSANHNGCNLLHHAAARDNYQIFTAVLKLMSNQVDFLSKKINYHGKLPLNMVPQRTSFLKQDQQKIRDDLVNVTKEKNVKPLTESIHFEDILKSYPLSDIHNKELLRNLNYGCIAASHVRKMIQASSTHPACNALSNTEYEQIVELMRDTRSQIKNQNYFVNFSHDDHFANYFSSVKKICEKNKIANCHEMSEITAYALTKMGVNQNIEVLHILKGDHVFVVIGRDPNSNLNDFTHWGPNAAIVDAWSGDVYPATQLENKLKSFLRYEYPTMATNGTFYFRDLNLTFFYEKNFNQLATVTCNGKPCSFFANNRYKDEKEFSQDEIVELNRNENIISQLKA